MFLLRAESVVQVKAVHAELVGIDNDDFVRHAASHPVVAANGLHPPDFVFVAESDAVGFIGAVLLKKGSETLHALAGGADIGQHENNDILFTDSSGDFFFAAAFRLLQLHQRVGRQNAGVGSNGFRSGDADVCLVDAGGCPDAFFGVHAGAGGIAERMIGQLDLHMGQNAFIFLLLLLRLDHDELFHVEVAVVRAGDHRGAVAAGSLADQNRCAGHRHPPLTALGKAPVFDGSTVSHIAPRFNRAMPRKTSADMKYLCKFTDRTLPFRLVIARRWVYHALT